MMDRIYFRRPERKIDLNDREEAQYWADRMGVSEEHLHSLCARHGHSASAVRSNLAH